MRSADGCEPVAGARCCELDLPPAIPNTLKLASPLKLKQERESAIQFSEGNQQSIEVDVLHSGR
jgi:hypothetical protein